MNDLAQHFGENPALILNSDGRLGVLELDSSDPGFDLFDPLVASAAGPRNEYAYTFNHEIGLFAGRCLGCGMFLGIAYEWSGNAAVKYALPVIALLQLLSIRVAGQIFRGLGTASDTSPAAGFTGHTSEA
jgi:hypothetical protein